MNQPQTFTARAVRAICSIPHGRVATYGQLAEMAGDPRGARQVVRILSTRSEKEKLPWHRVVNARGTISLTGEGGRLQRSLLEQERIVFDEAGRIDLGLFLWRP